MASLPPGPAYGSPPSSTTGSAPRTRTPPPSARTWQRLAQEFADKTVLVIGCGDSYVKLAAENKQYFPENCIAATVSGELINTLINKEKFYAPLRSSTASTTPATFIYRKEHGARLRAAISSRPTSASLPTAWPTGSIPSTGRREGLYPAPTGRTWRQCWIRSTPPATPTR